MKNGRIQKNHLFLRLGWWVSFSAVTVLLCMLCYNQRISAVLCGAASLGWLYLCLTRNGTAPKWTVTNVTGGIILSALAGKRFAYGWEREPRIPALLKLVGIQVSDPAAVVAILGCVAALPACVWAWERLTVWVRREKIGTRLKTLQRQGYGKLFCGLLVVYAVALLPLFRANVNYVDDVRRLMGGMRQWNNFSRYMTDYLASLIHCGQYLTDLSPLSQLLAAALMALSGVMLLYIVHGEQYRPTAWDVAALVPLGLCPYFLQCLSYKMDAPFMGFSVLFSVAPLTLYRRGGKVYWVATFLGSLAMCMTYQASSGIFPMTVVFLAFRMWNEKEKSLPEIGKFVASSATAYLAGLGVYSTLLMQVHESYVDATIAPVPLILSNYGAYFRRVMTDFHTVWLLLIAFLAVWFVVTAVSTTRQKKWMAMALAVLTAVLGCLLSFGIYPAMTAPLFTPRAVYGVGAYIVLLAVANPGKPAHRFPLRLGTTVLAWMFVVLAVTYGNALNEQQFYENFRREEVLADLTELPTFCQSVAQGEDVTVQISGGVGYAPSIIGDMEKYSVLKRMNYELFAQGHGLWTVYPLQYFYGLPETVKVVDGSSGVQDYAAWPILHESVYHIIYCQDNYFVVYLK